MMPLTVLQKCARCGAERPSLHGHHKVARHVGGDDSPGNIENICANCHADTHGGHFGGPDFGVDAAHTPEAEAKRKATMAIVQASPEYKKSQLDGARRAAAVRDNKALGVKISASWTVERRMAQAELMRSMRNSGIWDATTPMSNWSFISPTCLECGTSDLPHIAHGLCQRCYHRQRYHLLPKKTRKPKQFAHGECSLCHTKQWLQKHHLIAKCKGGTNDPTNIIQVCSNCHEDLHGGSFGRNLHNDPEIEAKRAAGVAAKWADPKWKAKHLAEMAEGNRGRDYHDGGRKASGKWTPEKRAAHAEVVSKAKKGKPMSEEQKKLLSEIKKRKYAEGYVNPRKGTTTPEETRRKQSEAKRGENHPNWGKHLPSTTRERIASSNRGKAKGPMSEDHKLKISNGLRRFRSAVSI